jgi:hypothetical protein
MALSVLSNYAADVAHRNLLKTDASASSSLAKLSSGQRIVQAKDTPLRWRSVRALPVRSRPTRRPVSTPARRLRCFRSPTARSRPVATF